jgi:hypothetical protein
MEILQGDVLNKVQTRVASHASPVIPQEVNGLFLE